MKLRQPFKCPYGCGKPYKTWEGLLVHWKMHRAQDENFEIPPKPIHFTEEDIKKSNKARKIKRAKARKMKEELDKIDFSEINRRNTIWMREKGYKVNYRLMENGLAKIVMNGKVKETVLSPLYYEIKSELQDSGWL